MHERRLHATMQVKYDHLGARGARSGQQLCDSVGGAGKSPDLNVDVTYANAYRIRVILEEDPWKKFALKDAAPCCSLRCSSGSHRSVTHSH